MAQQNEPSILLNQGENDLVFTIIGHRRQVWNLECQSVFLCSLSACVFVCLCPSVYMLVCFSVYLLTYLFDELSVASKLECCVVKWCWLS